MSDPFNEKDLNNKWHIDSTPTFHVEQGEQMARANRAVNDIGRFIQADCGQSSLRELEYLGSAAIHIYAGITGIIFVSQTPPLQATHEWLAEKAFQRLKDDLKVHYGHERKKATRSGV